MFPHELSDVMRALPGALGSLLSMLWMKETVWVRRCILFIGGTIFAVGAEHTVAGWVHLEEGFTLGFMLGLGSMAFFAKVFETWQAIDLSGWVQDLMRRWTTFGPPPLKPATPNDPSSASDPQVQKKE